MVRCSVIGCKSDSGRKMPDLSFHSFPKELALQKVWMAATGRQTLHIKNAKICSKHFEEKYFKKSNKSTFLLSGSVPTLFFQVHTAINKIKEDALINKNKKPIHIISECEAST